VETDSKQGRVYGWRSEEVIPVVLGLLRRWRDGCGPLVQRSGVVVAVVALVGDDEHGWLAGVALYVLPRRAPTHRAALVVAAAFVDKKTLSHDGRLRL
jgi:hypothetical protein